MDEHCTMRFNFTEAALGLQHLPGALQRRQRQHQLPRFLGQRRGGHAHGLPYHANQPPGIVEPARRMK
jgi:hypothetical protein